MEDQVTVIQPEMLGIDTTKLDRSQAITLGDVRRLRLVEGRAGHGQINPQTLQRYAVHGKKTADGAVVLLPAYFDPIKRLYLTQKDWVERWLQELAKRSRRPKLPRVRTPLQGGRGHRRAMDHLSREGLVSPPTASAR